MSPTPQAQVNPDCQACLECALAVVEYPSDDLIVKLVKTLDVAIVAGEPFFFNGSVKS